MLPVFLLLIVYWECLNLDWIPSPSLSCWIALGEIKPQSVWAVPFRESSQVLTWNYWKSSLHSRPRLDSDCVGGMVCSSPWGQSLPWLQLLFLKPLGKVELLQCWNWAVCAKRFSLWNRSVLHYDFSHGHCQHNSACVTLLKETLQKNQAFPNVDFKNAIKYLTLNNVSY